MPPIIRQTKAAEERPFLVIWEVTQACDLACQHCRASAQPGLHPQSLTFNQGRKLLRDIASFGSPLPLVVFTGGDPFKREELSVWIRYARGLGLHCGVSPSATPLLNRPNLAKIREAGASTISLSLDGSHAQLHDTFRGVQGSFDLTVSGWKIARELGFKLQINSTIGRHNLHDLVSMAVLVAELEVMTWSIFLLVPTGRAQSQDCLSAEEIEAVLHFLVEVSDYIPLKTTEGHHYKRVLLMRKLVHELSASLPFLPLTTRLKEEWQRQIQQRNLQKRAAARRAPLHLNSGHGFVFINHLGHAFPSGFLPISAGNIQKESLVSIYQESKLFQDLRRPALLQGRCGACEFKELCGGSRSRAFALSGNVLAEDPACNYQPGSFPFPQELQARLKSNPPLPARLPDSTRGFALVNATR